MIMTRMHLEIFWSIFLAAFGMLMANPAQSDSVPKAAQTTSPYIFDVSKASGPQTVDLPKFTDNSQFAIVHGNKQTTVKLYPGSGCSDIEYYYWSKNGDGSITGSNGHCGGHKITLFNVSQIQFSDGLASVQAKGLAWVKDGTKTCNYVNVNKTYSNQNNVCLWGQSCTGCSATYNGPINGSCGSSNGASLTAAPITDLCSTGTTSSVSGSGPWIWSCNGSNGGSNASCLVSLFIPPVNGACGTANGTSATSKPTANLCSNGAASSVSGNGPWAWSCSGSNGGSSPSCATVDASNGQAVMPPTVPQPQSNGDIVGVNIQNTTSQASIPHIFTFGQIFKKGQVQPTDRLVARVNGSVIQVQLDTLSNWPDGSVKLGAVTLSLPVISANSILPVLLSEAYGNGLIFNNQPVDLSKAPLTLTATLNFTSGQYSGTRQVDLGAALKQALANSPDYWLQGPLATQARVDIPLGAGPMHLTADVTAYADGSVTADVQFNNDITSIISGIPYHNPGALAPQIYFTTVTFGDQSQNYSITQYQYQDWHVVLNSEGIADHFVSSSQPPVFNAQHDLAYLEHSGAVLSYDRTTGVVPKLLQGWVNFHINQAGFGSPLAVNGVTQYMPMTGGRADIGFTTAFNTVWLMTGDPIAETMGLAQGDTAGAVPWNFKLANGHWLTPGDSPMVWTDPRSSTVTVANQIPSGKLVSGWSPDVNHEPNLAYVPYIMTGERWYLDRLNAEAAYGEDINFPGVNSRLVAQGLGVASLANTYDIVVNPVIQTRGAAWGMREVQEAGWIGKPGSFEQGFFVQATKDNWDYLQAIMPAETIAQGETAGWIENLHASTCAPTSGSGSTCTITPFMEDYFTGVALLGASMGDPGALAFINWQKDGWLSGRFIGQGMNPYDGTAYGFVMYNSATHTPYTTWAQDEAATVAEGISNGSVSKSTGYDQWAYGVLKGALTFYPDDTNLQKAVAWLEANAIGLDKASLQKDPTFNVTQLQ